MAAERGGNIMRYVYRGGGRDSIPDATHIFAHVKIIPAEAFWDHPHIVEVICHEDVVKIGDNAFASCPSLRRIIMPSVKVLEKYPFFECAALTDVECEKLEIIGELAFGYCRSLRSIYLPSARIVEESAFGSCPALTHAIFGNKLESIGEAAFYHCRSLERITIPLKDGLITRDDTIFTTCRKFNHVDLVEGELHETIAALHLEDWKRDMIAEINSICQILSNAHAGTSWRDDAGEKAAAVRSWIRSVLHKIIRYQSEHQHLLDQAAMILQFALPQDTVMNNIVPFLNLPSYTFEVNEDGEEDDDIEG